MEDKKSLASESELAKVQGKASLLAAGDCFVSVHSDVFISASPGNMHNAVVSTCTMRIGVDICCRGEILCLDLPFLKQT
jgi:hypothetical protein